jgi:hypothetical protein
MSKKVAADLEDDDDRAWRHVAARASFIIRGWRRGWADLVIECGQVQRALLLAGQARGLGKEIELLKELELCLFDELEVTIEVDNSEIKQRELADLKKRTAHIS